MTPHRWSVSLAHIVRMRKELGTQAQVGKILELHQNTIGRIETAGVPAPMWYQLAIQEVHRRVLMTE